MEYGGINPLSSKSKLKEDGVFEAIFQLINILVQMEELGISHLDIKPLNLVWNEKTKQLKMIDFGTSKIFSENRNMIMEPLLKNNRNITGYTRFYAPPEIVGQKCKYIIPQKVDAYCFGVTILELLMENYKGISTKKCNVFNNF